MNYLLDTNVISEPLRAKPDENVQKWFHQMPNHSLYVSVLTIGEIRKGIEKISDQKRKQKITLWLENSIPELFHNRILPITFEIADRWGRLQYQAKKTMPAIDCLLAATALHHDMALVTRNTKDYESCAGLEIINPWL